MFVEVGGTIISCDHESASLNQEERACHAHDVVVRLFGFCLHDASNGGDIDLLVETTMFEAPQNVIVYFFVTPQLPA